jgi:aryl-alcohol dehydrogenase-like predicted oxidoreductase
MRYLQVAKDLDLPRVVSIQNPYSLLNRSYEVGLAEISMREDVGLLAYSPLAFGQLSGKYLEGQVSPEARLVQFGGHFSRYNAPHALEGVKRYVTLARQHGLSPAQLALAFVNQQPFVTSNIIGATTLEQLQENLQSVQVVLAPDVLAEIEAIHQVCTYPCP